jgi:hypothetical protein
MAGPYVQLHSLTDNQAGDQNQTDKTVYIYLSA